jgi:hypothetical protein
MNQVNKFGFGVRRVAIAVSLLLGGLVAAGPLAPAAQAALDGCRADPVIYLSDGSALDVTADIGTSATNITGIAYTVHVPAGLRAVLYLATPTLGFKGKEAFTLVNDAPAGQYRTDTLVTTNNKGVAVTAHTTLVGVYVFSLSVSLQSKPAGGYSGDHLWTTVYR